MKWKGIQGYEGKYQISNTGLIKSNTTKYRGKLLKPRICNGYYSVTLGYKETRKHLYVHRLVALAYLDNFYNHNHVNHLDGNKLNNNVKNLELSNPKLNMVHARKMNLIKKPIKRQRGNLTESEVIEIKLLLKTDITMVTIARQFGVSDCAIRKINQGITHRNIYI